MPADLNPVSFACPQLQNYDPERALTDYISRLEALQRRLGSVQSGEGEGSGSPMGPLGSTRRGSRSDGGCPLSEIRSNQLPFQASPA